MPGHRFNIDIVSSLPENIARLRDLADNLWFSWHRPTRHLFVMLDRELWWRIGRNPRLFLRYVDQSVLETAAEDRTFLSTYRSVLAEYDAYHDARHRGHTAFKLHKDELIAYFCAEYGFHDSVPIYSGGLGILAGDHCKTASDLGLPFVAVGLLYRQGYFIQRIDAHGQQVAIYTTVAAHEIPVFPVTGADGQDLVVQCPLQSQQVAVKLWRAQVGRVQVILLDTDIEPNDESARSITRVLYGGDQTMRIRQEIILGIGGVRALRALNMQPTIWHINEGHAAFLLTERIRELVATGMPFDAALEAVAAASVFTTHTPVSAGHDVFDPAMVLDHLQQTVAELGIAPERFLALAHDGGEDQRFNMTRLAVTAARGVNGVSRLHGTVSAEILTSAWPQIPPQENPVGFVTNGVHVPTFMRSEWDPLLSEYLGPSWAYQLMDRDFTESIMAIPPGRFWYVRQQIKGDMLRGLCRRLEEQHRHNRSSGAHIRRMLRFLNPETPDVLTVGFARRFASYKRATLLFSDLDWLRALVASEKRPIVFVFAGKAHPADAPGQELMQEVFRLSNLPEFFGKVLLVEGYNMELGGLLTAGVDVWLNTPVFPLEASGTSGMKAAINGCVNLSVLDGWWAEGYDGTNGWGIPPANNAESDAERDHQDAQTLYEILQDEVIPMYYARDERLGFSLAWVERCKRAMATSLPYFNSQRFLGDYVRHFYLPAARHGRLMARDEHAAARALAQWKQRMREAWPGVQMRLLETPPSFLGNRDMLQLEIAVRLNGLAPEDVGIECVIARGIGSEISVPLRGHVQNGRPTEGLMYLEDEAYHIAPFQPVRALDDGEHAYRLSVPPPWCGHLNFEIRARPAHPHLAHPHELGLLHRLSTAQR
jgi:glycogen phosphorylase